MCFDDGSDYDWYADVQEETTRLTTVSSKCDECRRDIPEGSWLTQIYQQEHETCQICDDEDSWEYSVNFGPHECEYGETYTHIICRECAKILASIWQYEEKSGCPHYARQPQLGRLEEVFIEHQDALDYALESIRLFPELSGHVFFESMIKQIEVSEKERDSLRKILMK